MRDLAVTFAPIDALNPRCGYALRIESGARVLIYTSVAPDTGDPLRTPADCLRVLAMYIDEVQS